jgi:hypothetical protein
MFHGNSPPAEAAFDAEQILPMRERKPASAVLEDQLHLHESNEWPWSNGVTAETGGLAPRPSLV